MRRNVSAVIAAMLVLLIVVGRGIFVRRDFFHSGCATDFAGLPYQRAWFFNLRKCFTACPCCQRSSCNTGSDAL